MSHSVHLKRYTPDLDLDARQVSEAGALTSAIRRDVDPNNGKGVPDGCGLCTSRVPAQNRMTPAASNQSHPAELSPTVTQKSDKPNDSCLPLISKPHGRPLPSDGRQSNSGWKGRGYLPGYGLPNERLGLVLPMLLQ